MAKTSGGVRSGNAKGGIKSVKIAENSIRRNNFETLIAFNSKGKELLRVGGKQYSVNIPKDKAKLLENAIVTHNHPRALGKTGIRGIGNSFSDADLMSAVSNNVREIRATTPYGVTFSMKRPKTGWGTTYQEVEKVYNKYNVQVFKEYNALARARKTTIGKVQAIHFHEVNKRVARHFGWDYSKEK